MQTAAPMTEVRYAKGFSVEAGEGFTRVIVTRPWRDAQTSFEYILIARNAPPPADIGSAQVVEVPVSSVVAMSTTHLPHLEMLDALDSLVGVNDISHVCSPEVIELHRQGKVASIGHQGTVDLEQLAATEPELIFDVALGQADADNYRDMLAGGFSVAVNGEWTEDTPLARAEWIKFSALFLDRVTEAERRFDTMAAEYERLVQLTSGIATRPLIFAGNEFQGTWYVPGGASYVREFFHGAGARYAWDDDGSTGSITIDFEAVLERAKDAEYWFLHSGSFRDLEELIATDERYRLFKAVREGRVYCNDAQMSASGRNVYWESAIMHPDEVLADLIHIIHPEMLPSHRLTWYRRIPPVAEGRR